MNKKIIAIIGVLVLIILAGGAVWYFETQSNPLKNNNLVGANENRPVSGNNLNQNLLPSGENVFATDDFSLTYPAGWRSAPAITGVSAMIVKENENITNPEAKKMNFQTYLAVSYDSAEGKTKEQVAEYLKNELRSAIPDAVFSHENFLTLNQRAAYATEVTFKKSGVDFHVLMVAVWGEGNDLWVLSYNTLEELWQNYAGEFEEMTQAFVVKF